MECGYDRDRIERLRLAVRNCGYDYGEFAYYFYKSLKERGRDRAYALRVADAVYDTFDSAAPFIGADELIVGRIANRQFSPEEAEEFRLLREYAVRPSPSLNGQASHMAIDYDLLLNKGASGIIADIRRKRERLDLTQPGDIEKDNFYAACARALEGLIRFAERYADEAERQAAAIEGAGPGTGGGASAGAGLGAGVSVDADGRQPDAAEWQADKAERQAAGANERLAAGVNKRQAAGADGRRARELRQIAKNLRNVPRNPAAGFYEAVQSAHFVTFCLSARPFAAASHLYQPGRPDRYLWPFYKDDMESGRISRAFAQTLLDCYAIMLETRIPPGLASGYMVGGLGRDGRVVSNDLTRMLMEAIRHIRLIYPGVGLCWRPETPEADLRLACEILGEGHSHPAIFNDAVISKGLEFHGLTAAESREYIHSTCVEITPAASSNVWVASPYMNLAQKLLDVLFAPGANSKSTNAPGPNNESADAPSAAFGSMDALLDAYFARVEDGIRENLVAETRLRVERAKYMTDPLLSCFVNDCLEKGADIEAGGARYNWIMPSFVGLSNVADALTAIEKLVFNERLLDFDTLRAALSANFAGYEPVRQLLLNGAPKYGNDDAGADKYVVWLTGWLVSAMEKYQKNKENYLVPSLFCWVMHDMFGQKTGATPDGRLAGFPLGDGSGPAQGRELAGPTAAALSSTKWDHHKFIGGVAVNMKFSKKMFNAGSVEKLMAIVRTYMERGGFELQINVLDRDTLLKARENPDAYRDVVVRIGGYSDYFVRLSPTMQEEVLARTEYLI